VTDTAEKKALPEAESTDKPDFCSNCGTPVDKDAEFCKKCGKKII
jgi:predicted amidophosphoribosyltransferase